MLQRVFLRQIFFTYKRIFKYLFYNNLQKINKNLSRHLKILLENLIPNPYLKEVNPFFEGADSLIEIQRDSSSTKERVPKKQTLT